MAIVYQTHKFFCSHKNATHRKKTRVTSSLRNVKQEFYGVDINYSAAAAAAAEWMRWNFRIETFVCFQLSPLRGQTFLNLKLLFCAEH